MLVLTPGMCATTYAATARVSAAVSSSNTVSWIVQHVVHDVLRSRCGTPIELLLPQRRLATDLASEEEADEGGAENHEERVLTQLDRRNQHVLPLMRGGSPHNFLYLLRGRFSLTTFRKQFHCGPERVHQSPR